jgi:hypothetical protein
MIEYEDLAKLCQDLGDTLTLDSRQDCEARGIDPQGFERWVSEMSAIILVALITHPKTAIATGLDIGFQVGYTIGVMADV